MQFNLMSLKVLKTDYESDKIKFVKYNIRFKSCIFKQKKFITDYKSVMNFFCLMVEVTGLEPAASSSQN